MKRYVLVLALACALVLAVGLSSATAGLLPNVVPTPPPPGPGQGSGQNGGNVAIAVSPTVAALNNLAGINTGDQTTVAGTSQSQGNTSGTDHTPAPDPNQNDGQGGQQHSGQEWNSGPSSAPSSSGASQHLDQEQKVNHEPERKNEAVAISPTVAALNNLALINTGDQTTVAGTSQSQGNAYGGEQKADQDQQGGSGPGRPHDGDKGKGGEGCRCDGDEHSPAPAPRPEHGVKNDTHQKNVAFAISPTLAAGNNLALINEGDQTTIAGTSQSQGNSYPSDRPHDDKGDRRDEGSCHEQPAPTYQRDQGKGDCRPKDDQHPPKGGPGHCYEQPQSSDWKQGHDDCRPKDEHHPPKGDPGHCYEQPQSSDWKQGHDDCRPKDEQHPPKGDPGHCHEQPAPAYDRQQGKDDCRPKDEQHPPKGRPHEKGDRGADCRCHEQPQRSERKHGKDDCRPKGEQHPPKSRPHENGRPHEKSNRKDDCRPKDEHSTPRQHPDQGQPVKNETQQKNVAFAISPTVAVLNNLALINCGDQTTVAGTSQSQGNSYGTVQRALAF